MVSVSDSKNEMFFHQSTLPTKRKKKCFSLPTDDYHFYFRHIFKEFLIYNYFSHSIPIMIRDGKYSISEDCLN